MKTMTPNHDRWNEFYMRLSGKEGCNFQDVKGKYTWTCKGGNDKGLAAKILVSMGMDVDSSLAYFHAHGGHCDCEIIFNVDESDD